MLAHLLARHGAGPGETVALLFTRSAEAIIAILAVLKSGAAYLPIDPAHPDARIAFMIADAAPVATITTTDLRPRAAEFDIPVIEVDGAAHGGLPDSRLADPAPEDLAYLIHVGNDGCAQSCCR